MMNLLVFVCSILLTIFAMSRAGTTSNYVRVYEPSEEMPLETFPPPPGYNAPEQFFLFLGSYNAGRGMIISWVTPKNDDGSNVVKYWIADSNETTVQSGEASTTTYRFFDYTSSFLHHATINDLEYDTKYFYELGSGRSTRRFSFITPPKVDPDVPYTFGLIGDLGQTFASNQTLYNYTSNPKGQAVLFVGDPSYADDSWNHDNRKWDSYARFVEASAAYQAWFWAAGNHEIDYAPQIWETEVFKPYTNRYHVPYKASQSTSPLWYSFKRASAYVIVLSSYSAFDKYTPQYSWLESEFKKVNREETPWLIVMIHSPWYNSDNYHYMEGESMRVTFEPWFVQNKVDIVLAGHVHAYERSERVSNIRYNITDGLSSPVKDPSAPIYITIGDGGNREGIANNYIYPQPDYSTHREASFGHAMLEIKNRTHALFTWHRNQDNEPVIAASLWVKNRYYLPELETSMV